MRTNDRLAGAVPNLFSATLERFGAGVALGVLTHIRDELAGTHRHADGWPSETDALTVLERVNHIVSNDKCAVKRCVRNAVSLIIIITVVVSMLGWRSGMRCRQLTWVAAALVLARRGRRG